MPGVVNRSELATNVPELLENEVAYAAPGLDRAISTPVRIC